MMQSQAFLFVLLFSLLFLLLDLAAPELSVAPEISLLGSGTSRKAARRVPTRALV